MFYLHTLVTQTVNVVETAPYSSGTEDSFLSYFLCPEIMSADCQKGAVASAHSMCTYRWREASLNPIPPSNLIINRHFFRFHYLALNFIHRQTGIAQLDKAPDIVALQLSALKSQPDGVGIKQMAGIQAH